MLVELTDSNYKEIINNTEQPIVVDLWAEWCGPCKMIDPIIKEMDQEYDGKAVMAKLNVDENPEVTGMFGIRNIPTVLFLKNGEVEDKQVGAVPKQVFTGKLEALL